MHLSQSSCLWLAALMLPTLASAQCYDAYLLGTYDGTAMQLVFSVGHRTFGPETCSGDAVAFDVYRSTLGYECGLEARVTEEPVPIVWPIDDLAVFEAHCTDPGVTSNTAYRYEARLVDAQRNPARGAGVNSIWGYGVAGTALLSHGQIDTYDNFQVYFSGCPGECFPSGLLYPAQWEVPFGTTVDLYGTGVGVRHESQLWIPELQGTSMRPSTCLVAVMPVAWSTWKRLYD